MLVVVRLDRLARSVSHLLEVIEDLTAKGAHFRSLRDPIDTSTPQRRFSLQVLGAVAQLERALISERTKAGIRAAKAKGRLPSPVRSAVQCRERPPEKFAGPSQARCPKSIHPCKLQAALIICMDDLEKHFRWSTRRSPVRIEPASLAEALIL